MLETLENEFLKIVVKDDGGSLTSVFDKKRNKECLYQPLENSWQGQDIFIFPFIARLKDGYYLHKGEKYELKNHGLIRYMKGKITKENEKIKVSFNSDEETLKRYPFDFEANIIYELNQNKLKISYEIFNKNDEEMPFELGAHPAFLLPGKVDNNPFIMGGNTIEFDSAEELYQMKLEETGSFIIDKIPYENNGKINLTKDLFVRENTLILKSENINEFKLNKTDGCTLILNKGKAPFVAIRSDKVFGNYVCIEPWFGVPDMINPEREITKKKYMQFIKANGVFKYNYEIEIA